MYADPDFVDKTTLFQGDIIDDFPFYNFENSYPIKKDAGGRFELDGDDNSDRSVLAVETKKQKVIILSQTCDIQRRSNVIVCPVYELKEVVDGGAINLKRVEALKSRRIYYWFYLPEFQVLQESFADLQTMVYVPRDIIEKYVTKRAVSLSDLGRHHLAWSLATYFGRPAEE